MSDIREKVKKLLAFAADGRGNENEAESAMRMAEGLMRKHSIDISELQAASGKAATFNWKSVTIPVGEKARPTNWSPMWLGILSYGVGQFTDCRVSWTNHDDYHRCIKFEGDEWDIEYAAWLFKKVRDIGYAEAYALPGNQRDQFRKGFASKLCARMRNLRAERDAAMKAAVTSTGNALVLVHDKLIQRDSEFGKQGVRKSRPANWGTEGFSAGSLAANNVSLNKPIGGGSKALLS